VHFISLPQAFGFSLHSFISETTNLSYIYI